MSKLTAIVSLLWQGREVADPAKWSRGAITVNTLVPVLAAVLEVLRAFGVPIAITGEQMAQIAGGVLALFNVVVLAASRRDVGLPRGSQADHALTDAGSPAQPEPACEADNLPRPVAPPQSSIRDPGPG